MPFPHKDGYNISTSALFFHSLPHLQLTSHGLLPLHNTTFDYDSLPYVNSLLVTLTLPLLLLLFIFAFYLVYALVVRTLQSEERRLLRHLEIENQRKTGFGKKEKREKPKCCAFYVVLGCLTVIGAAYGTWLTNNGLNETDTILSEFIRVSLHSQQTIGNFSQGLLPAPVPVAEYEYGEYLDMAPSALHSSTMAPNPPPPTSAFQRWFPNTYRTLATYANYTNSSGENILAFQDRFRHATIALTAFNGSATLLLALFWALFLGVTVGRLGARHFLLANVLLLLLLTFAFTLNLTGSTALGDFCASAKPVIGDITVYKIPSNNFTTKFVNYYLYCELNRLGLDVHKDTVLGYLDRLDSYQLFNASRMLQGLVSGVKSGIERSYDTLHCREINGLINGGLSELCTGPIDGLAMVTASSLVSVLLFVLVLFMVTFNL